MATLRKTTKAKSSEDFIDEIPENDAPPTVYGDESDSLQAMLAELAGASSAKVTVYRHEKNRPLGYVCACTPDAFSLDDLRDKYNGGEFRLFISRNGVLWKNVKVFVEPRQMTAADEPAPSALAELAAVMREGFKQQSDVLREASRKPALDGESFLSRIDIPATITAISAALVALRPPPPPPPPPSSADTAVEMLLKGIELARELKPDSGGGDGLMGLVRDVMSSPLLAAAVQSAKADAQPAVKPTQNFASETPKGQTMPVLKKPEPKIPAQVTFYLDMLCQKAQAESDPTLYAELILDSLPDEYIAQLLDGKPTPVDALIALHAPIANHRAWFESVVSVISSAMSAESDDNQGSDDALEPPPQNVP